MASLTEASSAGGVASRVPTSVSTLRADSNLRSLISATPFSYRVWLGVGGGSSLDFLPPHAVDRATSAARIASVRSEEEARAPFAARARGREDPGVMTDPLRARGGPPTLASGP